MLPFQRLCPGCTQRKLQMNAAPCEICGRVNPVEAPRPREKMHFSARMMRALLQPLGRMAQASTFIFCGFAVWAMTLGWILPFFGVAQNGLVLSGLMVSFMWITRLATRAAVWVFAPATRKSPRGGGRTFLVLPVCLAVLLVANHFDAPLRMAFLLSESALERVKPTTPPMPTNTRWGVPAVPATPSIAGFYRTKTISLDRQYKRIQVIDSTFLWSGTKAGFAKCPGGCQDANFPNAYMRDYEEPKYLQLSKNWFWWEISGTDD